VVASGEVAARCRENAEGEETAREAVAGQGNHCGDPRQRHQSGQTLERSERLREESSKRSNSVSPGQGENLKDRLQG